MDQEGKNDTFEPNAGMVSACKTSNDMNTSVGQIKTENKPKSMPVNEEEVEPNASGSGCVEPIQNPNLVLNCELTDSQGSYCNKCKSQVETMYHCTVCNNFDLCLNCKQKEGHPHIMEKFSLKINNASLADAKQESWKFSAQKYMSLLVHACRCKKMCSGYCEKMKRVVIHVKNCKICIIGDCPVGKQFNGVCFHHARHCELVKCVVPFCKDMKNKLKEKEHQIQQAQLQNERMDVMKNTQATGSNIRLQSSSHQANSSIEPAHLSATDLVTAHDQQQQEEQQPEQQQQQPSIDDISRQLPRQHRVNDIPLIEMGWTPMNIRALRQLKEVLRMPQSIEQHLEVLHILSSNPSLIAILSRQRLALIRAGLSIGNRLAGRKSRNIGS